jgi:hypothetical protein
MHMATNNSINSVLIGSVQTGAFGPMMVAEPEAVIQLSFPYNINTEYALTSVTGSGTATQANAMLLLQTTAAASSSATMTSKYILDYQTGQGSVCLFTTIYTTGVANSTQITGIGDTVNGFFFGYNAATFGILHRNASADTWVAQTNWNMDKLDGSAGTSFTLDPTKGNIYKIQFQWLGFGCINFFVENPNTGAFVQVHQIRYPNANTAVSLSNPSLPITSQVINTSNTTNISIKNGSFSAYIEGPVKNINLRNCTGNTKSLTTLLNIVSIKNKTTFVSKTNMVTMIIDSITIFNGGLATDDGLFSLYINATLGGSPSYTDISTNTSVASFDIAGTTITNGRKIFDFYVGGTTTQTIDLSSYNIRIVPGDVLTIGGTSIVGGATNFYASASWQEKF